MEPMKITCKQRPYALSTESGAIYPLNAEDAQRLLDHWTGTGKVTRVLPHAVEAGDDSLIATTLGDFPAFITEKG